MKPVKNIILHEMMRLTQSFCTDHLAVFLHKFELKSAQLHALGTGQTATDVLAATQLPKSAHKEFTNTFLASTLYTFADFQGKLEHSSGQLDLTDATSATLEGELALPVMIDKAEQRFSELLYTLNKRLSAIGQYNIITATNPRLILHWRWSRRFRICRGTCTPALSRIKSLTMNFYGSWARSILT